MNANDYATRAAGILLDTTRSFAESVEHMPHNGQPRNVSAHVTEVARADRAATGDETETREILVYVSRADIQTARVGNQLVRAKEPDVMYNFFEIVEVNETTWLLRYVYELVVARGGQG